MALTPAQQRAQLTFALVITLLTLGWSTVMLRLWVRLRITRNPGWDDATMVLTLCLFSCYCAFILVIDSQGSFSKRLTVETIRQILMYIQLSEIFYVLTTTTLKISLGLFFIRLITKRWQIVLFHTILAISAVYGFFYTFVTLFQCGSPNKLLDNLLSKDTRCLPGWFLLSTGYLYGSINVIADWTFVLIPIFILLESDMNRRSKISVSLIMALGAVGSVSSIMRMVYLKGLSLTGHVSADAVRATIWATAEPGTGIVAASIAVLRPLFRQIKTEVKDKVSDYKASKHSRGLSTISNPIPTQKDSWDTESVIGLTTIITGGSANTVHSKKTSMYSIRSPTWDPNVTIEEARVGKFINVRMMSGRSSPVDMSRK